MLFTFGDSVVESEKERNLYYKYFAGYFFNELVSGWETRLSRFTSLLEESAREASVRLKRPVLLNPASTHVSFDCHAYLFGVTADKGEFADVLVYDDKSRCLIAIEAKFLTDWSFAKDVEQNGRRLAAIQERLSDTLVVQCLLVTQEKWNNAVDMARHPKSNYARFHSGPDVVPLMWDRLIPICDDAQVRGYFSQHIRRKRGDFRRES